MGPLFAPLDLKCSQSAPVTRKRTTLEEFDEDATDAEKTPLIQSPWHATERSTQLRLEGGDLVQRGETERALIAFNNASKEDPKKLFICIELAAQAFLLSGMYFKAILAAKRSVELNPYFAEGHLTLARSLLAYGEISESIKHFVIAHSLASQAALPLDDASTDSETDQIAKATAEEADLVSEENSLATKIAAELNSAKRLEFVLKRRYERAQEEMAFLKINDRWFGGAQPFYETGIKVDHGQDELWKLVRERSKKCCG